MAITRVQINTAHAASGPSGSCSFSSNVTVGNLLTVQFVISGGITHPTSVTDSLGNTYTQQASEGFGTGLTSGNMYSYTAPVTTGGVCLVTIAATPNTEFVIEVAEYTSTLGALSADNKAVNNGSGTGTGSAITIGGGSLPTFTQTTELCVVSIAWRPTTNATVTAPSSPWVSAGILEQNTNSHGLAVSNYVSATSGTASPTWTVTWGNGTAYAWGTIYITISEPASAPIFFDERAWIAQSQSQPWTAIAYTDEHGWVPNISLDQESQQLPPLYQQANPWLPKAFLDDELWSLFPQFTNIDEDYHWVARLETQPWQAVAFLDEAGQSFPVIITSGQAGNWRVQNAIQGYNLWVGSGALPDLTAAPAAFSATLPFNYTLALPGSGTATYYVLVTAQDLYGLNSQNQFYTTFTIDSSGNLILPVLNAPQSFAMLAQASGIIRVISTYPGYGKDQYPATQWRVWINTTPPNPLVDTPTATYSVTGQVLFADIGTYAPGLYYGAVALYRLADSAQSPALTGSVTIPAAPGEPVALPSGFQQVP